MSSMWHQYKEALREIRSFRQGKVYRGRVFNNHGAPMAWQIVAMWSLYNGWSAAETTRQTGGNVAAIRRLRRELAQEPRYIFRVSVLRVDATRDPPRSWCAFCDASLAIPEDKAREHVALHMLPGEIVRDKGVMPKLRSAW